MNAVLQFSTPVIESMMARSNRLERRDGRCEMDRDTLMDAVRLGPVEISLNDGQKIIVPSSEFCVVDDIAARVLYWADDGSMKTKIAALVCMTTITPVDSQQPNES
jgi:hypothetical protein